MTHEQQVEAIEKKFAQQTWDMCRAEQQIWSDNAKIERLEAENAELVSDLKTVVNVLSGEIILLSPVEGLKIRDSELTIGERAIKMAGRIMSENSTLAAAQVEILSSGSQGAAPGTVTMQAARRAALQLQQSP